MRAHKFSLLLEFQSIFRLWWGSGVVGRVRSQVLRLDKAWRPEVLRSGMLVQCAGPLSTDAVNEIKCSYTVLYTVCER
jgi:hypothetical protein